MKAAVTGYFGTGKSLFCNYLSKASVKVINADEEGRVLLDENKKEIFKFLGIKYNDNYLEELKEHFLKNNELFNIYNKWMYERLPERLLKIVKRYEFCILDAALVFEWGIEGYFENVILLKDGDFNERFKRIKKERKNADIELYKLLESRQLNEKEKELKADIVILNAGNKEMLKRKAYEIHDSIFVF